MVKDSSPVGAVGASDMDAFFDSVPHCTDGDYLPGVGYPRTLATANSYLRDCRQYLLDHFEAALRRARDLVDPKTGTIVKAEAQRDCRFVDGVDGLRRFNAFLVKLGLTATSNVKLRWFLALPLESHVERIREYFRAQRALTGQSAKCRTLGHLGRVLHLTQDFYAHGNWTDLPDSTRPIGVGNPPGLGLTMRSPLLDPLTKKTDITPGLITACFSFPLLDECRGRIDHDHHLAKDKGHVSIEYAQAPPWKNDFIVTRLSKAHPRSLHDRNFERAVRGAIKESRGLWEDFGTELKQRYPRDAATMLCILTRDGDARHYCSVRVFRYRIALEMTGGSSSWTHDVYRRSDPNYLGNYRGSGTGSSSWRGEWREVQIRLNRTDRRVFSANTVSSSFTGKATGEWTDRQHYNEPPDSLAGKGHTCRYDHQENRATAARIGVLPLLGDGTPHADDDYDQRELFTLVASGPSVSASCAGFRTDPVRPQEHAYDGTYLCQFALDRLYEKAVLPIRIPISRLGDDRISLERSFQHTAGGCFVGGGIGDPTEYCDQGGFCWKGTKSRTGTLRVLMTLIKP